MEEIYCIIVDDENEPRERMVKLLSQIEDVTIIATIDDSDKAIELILETEPHLVFQDIEMPRKSGFDVVKEIRLKGINSKFIFVTSFDQYTLKAIKEQAFDYLLKPVDVDELRETIERFRVISLLNPKKKRKIIISLPIVNKKLLNYLFRGKPVMRSLKYCF